MTHTKKGVWVPHLAQIEAEWSNIKQTKLDLMMIMEISRKASINNKGVTGHHQL